MNRVVELGDAGPIGIDKALVDVRIGVEQLDPSRRTADFVDGDIVTWPNS